MSNTTTLARCLRTSATVLPLLLCAVKGVVAQDIQVAGITVADRVTLPGQKLLLNGAGVRTLFGFHVYLVSLYLPVPVREAARALDGGTARRLQITLLRDTTTEQNLDALKEGLNDNNDAAELDAIKAEVALFFALVRQVHDIPSGTVIQLDYLPRAGTTLRIGGRNLGFVPGERFNRAILKVWLGAEPIQASLKKALLGVESPAL